MLDIAWPELIVVGAVALIAIGPEDMPKVMYTFGRWLNKARAFTRDMGASLDQISREAEAAEALKKGGAAQSPKQDGKT